MSLTQSELAAQLTKLPLTPRLLDVLALLLQGKSNKIIARELSLSTETVKEYVATIRHVASWVPWSGRTPTRRNDSTVGVSSSASRGGCSDRRAAGA